MLVSEAGYDLIVDRTLTVATNATSYLEIPKGYFLKKLTLWNQTTTATYGVYYCGSNETISVTGADVEYVSSVAVTGVPGQITTTAKTLTGISAAAAASITSAGHGFPNVTGNQVYITGVVDAGTGGAGTLASAVNGKVFTITYVSADAFTIPVNSTALDAYASGGTAQLAANAYDGKYFKIGAAAPYAYHKIYSSTNAGVFYVDGRPIADSDAEIVTLPNQVIYAGSTRDVYYPNMKDYIQFKAVNGTCTLQAIGHCVRA